jgi:4-phytase/acid phosphatase
MHAKFLSALCVFTSLAVFAQSKPNSNDSQPELKYVVYLTRHGVRSPTGKSAQYAQFSAAPWPTWEGPPGYLTAHGFEVIQKLGRYDRQLLASQGLLTLPGCAPAHRVTIYADPDQRTRETGKALAAGMFPACNMPLAGLAEGENDPLFHPLASEIEPSEAAVAAAAIAGRIGNQPAAIANAYRTQLTALDNILGTCGMASPAHERTSIFAIPASLSASTGDHAAELRGPLNTAATLTENLLLEYTEGMPTASVGWGCVNGQNLRALIDLHTAASDLAQRTPEIAVLQASNLLRTIQRALQRSVTQQPAVNTPGNATDEALMLIGHDTNLSNLAGLLNLSWLADGRRDDTPPGSTLVFELWRTPASNDYAVRVFFMTQTLEQMRSGETLDLRHPPERVPVFVPGCSRVDFSCTLAAFSHLTQTATRLRSASDSER